MGEEVSTRKAEVRLAWPGLSWSRPALVARGPARVSHLTAWQPPEPSHPPQIPSTPPQLRQSHPATTQSKHQSHTAAVAATLDWLSDWLGVPRPGSGEASVSCGVPELRRPRRQTNRARLPGPQRGTILICQMSTNEPGTGCKRSRTGTEVLRIGEQSGRTTVEARPSPRAKSFPGRTRDGCPRAGPRRTRAAVLTPPGPVGPELSLRQFFGRTRWICNTKNKTPTCFCELPMSVVEKCSGRVALRSPSSELLSVSFLSVARETGARAVAVEPARQAAARPATAAWRWACRAFWRVTAGFLRKPAWIPSQGTTYSVSQWIKMM